MKRRKLLARRVLGAVQNVAFADLQSLVAGAGFQLRRVGGSHYIYSDGGAFDFVAADERAPKAMLCPRDSSLDARKGPEYQCGAQGRSSP